MAFTIKGPIVKGARETTGAQAVTLQTGFATGDVVVAFAATKATGVSGTHTDVTITDSKGNSYVRAIEYSSGGILGVSASLFYTEVTAALVSGDTVSIEISSGLSQFQVLQVAGFTKDAGTFVQLQVASGQSPATAQTTASPAIANQPSANYLWLLGAATRQSATQAVLNFSAGTPTWQVVVETWATGTTGGTTASGIRGAFNYATGGATTGASATITGFINGDNPKHVLP